MQAKTKKEMQIRLRRVEGQVQGLQRMVEREEYCVDIIRQASAVRQALSAVEDAMLENHLLTHVVAQMKGGKHKKAADEILSVYKISKKK